MNRKGTVLLETTLAMFIMTMVGVSLLAMIQRAALVSFKAREQMTCSRMVQTGFARLKNLDFYQLFAADSSLPDYGLQASYPYRAALDGLRSTLAASRFDRFRVGIVFMRRDASDANGNGMNSDLIAFTDSNSDQIDDYDPAIRHFDQNLDGDFFDTFTSNGRTVAEQPDTHIKQVTLEVFRGSRRACSQTELVSLEQFTGDPNPSSEAVLKILISTPVNSAYLYDLSTQGRAASWNLPIAKAYPAEPARYRAEPGAPLELAGETDPLATVRFYVGASPELANIPADFSGLFSWNPSAVTGALVEGANLIRVQATKDAYISPIAPRSVILDLASPAATSPTPAGTVGTLSPYVSIILTDPGISTTVTSGICPDVLTLRVNGVEVSHSFAAGALVWIDSTTQTVPVLADGAYAVVAEAGDFAGYKTSAAWSFTVAVPATDNSAPSVANKTPIGASAPSLPQISVRVFDNQSGITPSSIVMKLDGITVVDASNLGSYYDAGADTVSYIPPTPFASFSSHTVEITASHWATDPPDKVTTADSWSFTIQ